ncbi:TetR/AcrR family transcriptional regulator, partial [Streptomyces turgidiscabies]|uniref:TetR/AcrR family transcriptional regulator n=1 Tax=Streptomyces turgidiscabies TaxID=85558 RepID=UPI0038F77F81
DRSAVWRHFADKQDLLDALNDRLLSPIVDAAEVSATPVDKLAAVYRGFLEVYAQHPVLAQELLGTSPLGDNWRRLAEIVVTAL